MRYALLVLAGPKSGTANLSAARFAAAAIERGHEIQRVFFLDEGVRVGLATAVAPQDESDALSFWRELHGTQGTELVLCVSSALRHGILNEGERERHERSAATMDDCFEIGGLGLLVDVSIGVDRLLTFGGRT